MWVAYALYHTLNHVHNSCTNRLKQEFECMNICSRRVPVISIQVTGWIRFILGPHHLLFLDNHLGHQYRHKSAYRIPAKKRQPISISRHIFHDSRICSGAIEHGELQTQSRRSRRAITWPLAISVMNANTSPRRRTRTPLNHVSL